MIFAIGPEREPRIETPRANLAVDFILRAVAETTPAFPDMERISPWVSVNRFIGADAYVARHPKSPFARWKESRQLQRQYGPLYKLHMEIMEQPDFSAAHFLYAVRNIKPECGPDRPQLPQASLDTWSQSIQAITGVPYAPDEPGQR